MKFLLTLFIISPLFASAAIDGIVAIKEVNCRQSANADSPRFGAFLAGQKVRARGILKGGWLPVYCPGGEQGWVNGKYLNDGTGPMVVDFGSSADACQQAQAPANVTPPKPFTKPAGKVSYIGDSQSASAGTVGIFLNEALDNNGVKLVGGTAVCSALATDYIDGGVPSRCTYDGITHMAVTGGEMAIRKQGGTTISAAAAAKNADAVIVQLGDNPWGDPEAAGSQAAKLARKILETGKDCVWIGPASVGCECEAWGMKKRASEAIKTALAVLTVGGNHCRFIDSFELSRRKPPGGDCKHYSESGYRDWKTAVEGQLLSVLGGRAAAPMQQLEQVDPVLYENQPAGETSTK